MTWRYFYSTEESDTALKAILDASKFSKEYTRNVNGLTDGVIEYKVWIEQDSEFELLQSKVDNEKIRALASPERVTQFGNIRPDNYFDSTKYAAGCVYRVTGALADVINYLNIFPASTLFAQRDLDILGSASLGSVVLTLSSLYKKTYNVPVNGSVSDRTLVKATRDSTDPAATQTNATCNQYMIDFASFARTKAATYSDSGWVTKPSGSPIPEMEDYVWANTNYYYTNGTGTLQIDYGQSVTKKVFLYLMTLYMAGSSPSLTFDYSVDGQSWTNLTSWGVANNNTNVSYLSAAITFRYLRLYASGTGDKGFRLSELCVQA